MMKKRYWVVLIFSILLIGALTVLLERDRFYFATDYSNLQLKIKTQSVTIDINPWISEEGDIYYFLPSCIGSAKDARFNISSKSSIKLENSTVSYKDDVLDLIQYDIPLSIELVCDDFYGEKKTVYFYQSRQIPSVHIATKHSDIDAVNADKSYISQMGEIRILDADGQELFAGGYDSLKARGNSTYWLCDKKSYQVSFEKDTSLFGLNSSKKWILLAQALDGTAMRNKVVYEFSNNCTSVMAPNSEYVDLYVDDIYCGNYLLCESVQSVFEQINEVNLEEKNIKLNSEQALLTKNQYVSEDGTIHAIQDMKNPDDITGGYLVEYTNEYENCRSGFITNAGLSFRIISPQYASVEQVEYLRDYFNAIEEALSNADGICERTGKHYSEYIDVESWVDYYLINEVFQDPDSAASSCYFYKQSDSIDSKVYAGPAWDFDMALGVYVVGKNRFDDPNTLANFYRYSEYLYNRSEIKEIIVNRYETIFSQKGKRNLESIISINEQRINDSMNVNYIRWPQSSSMYYLESFETNTDYLADFIADKIDFLDEYWCSDNVYHRVVFLDYDKNVCKEIYVKHGEKINTIPDCKAYVAIFGGWYAQNNDIKLTENTRIYEDVTYISSWYELEPMVLNMLAISECDISDYNPEDLEKVLKQIQKMKEEQTTDSLNE